jgi:hypothetical protein
MIDDSSKDYVLTVARFLVPCNHGKKKLMGWAPNTLIIFERADTNFFRFPTVLYDGNEF